MDSADEKIELRRRLKKKRAALSMEQAAASSLQAVRHILACDAYRKAKCIMGYLAFGRELSMDLLLEQALADGKQAAVPQIISATEIRAVLLHGMRNLELDCYGIRSVREPAQEIEPSALDLIIVPGVAFGRDGTRLGMGAGYYDRFLPHAGNAVLMGAAYDALLENSLPCDAHDVRMQFLVSESGIRKI